MTFVYPVFCEGGEWEDHFGYLKEIFDSEAKATAFIEKSIRDDKIQKHLDELNRYRDDTFSGQYEIDNPYPQLLEKPKFNHFMAGRHEEQKEYAKLHEKRVHEWRENYEVPYKNACIKLIFKLNEVLKALPSVEINENIDLNAIKLDYNYYFEKKELR